MAKDWRSAKSLVTLLAQVNQLAPKRDKSNDGTIGDASHAARQSEHNPDANGIVRALDITNDPAHGVDSQKLAEQLIESRDPRILYVISNRRIASSQVSPWQWRTYTGTNPHDHHMHVSVVSDPRLYGDVAPWKVKRTDGAPAGETDGTEPAIKRNRVLRQGATGDDVKIVQRVLGVNADGVFAGSTKHAVEAFQVANGLTNDGVVGPSTWDVILRAKDMGRPMASTYSNIIATEFGGKGDEQPSAYNDVPSDWPTKFGVALPARFAGWRPLVKVTHGARSEIAPIVDVGPWNTNDAYWLKVGGRPQAESGRDSRGRTTNRAGIDLTPALADALGIDGKGVVDWQFVQTGV